MNQPGAATPPVLRPGKPDYAINPLIAGRWSSRAIDPTRDVAETILLKLMDAARWSASCFNGQPWAYVVATRKNPELLAQAQNALVAGNAWARNAPVLMFSLSRKRFPGRFIPNRLHRFETGLATGQMALQAAEEGLVFHQMLGFNPWRIRSVFRVPYSYTVLSAIAVGYPGPIELVPEPKREAESAPRTRKPITEFAFIDRVFPKT